MTSHPSLPNNFSSSQSSSQTNALGTYRHDVAYAAALKSAQALSLQVGNSTQGQLTIAPLLTGVEHGSAPVIVCMESAGLGHARP